MQGTAEEIATRVPIYSSTTGASLRWHLRALIAQRNLIWELTARNLKVRYRRSVFGYLWTLLNPLLNALVFTFLFGVLLKSAQVPSVLIELAYVSNRQDAANLRSDEWRERVSASLVGAVNRYFSMSRLPL